MSAALLHRQRFCIISVLRFEDVWIIDRNGRKLRVTFSLEQAVTEAVRLGRLAHLHAAPAEVVFNDGRHCKTLWRCGRLVADDPVTLQPEHTATKLRPG